MSAIPNSAQDPTSAAAAATSSSSSGSTTSSSSAATTPPPLMPVQLSMAQGMAPAAILSQTANAVMQNSNNIMTQNRETEMEAQKMTAQQALAGANQQRLAGQQQARATGAQAIGAGLEAGLTGIGMGASSLGTRKIDVQIGDKSQKLSGLEAGQNTFFSASTSKDIGIGEGGASHEGKDVQAARDTITSRNTDEISKQFNEEPGAQKTYAETFASQTEGEMKDTGEMFFNAHKDLSSQLQTLHSQRDAITQQINGIMSILKGATSATTSGIAASATAQAALAQSTSSMQSSGSATATQMAQAAEQNAQQQAQLVNSVQSLRQKT